MTKHKLKGEILEDYLEQAGLAHYIGKTVKLDDVKLEIQQAMVLKQHPEETNAQRTARSIIRLVAEQDNEEKASRSKTKPDSESKKAALATARAKGHQEGRIEAEAEMLARDEGRAEGRAEAESEIKAREQGRALGKAEIEEIVLPETKKAEVLSEIRTRKKASRAEWGWRIAIIIFLALILFAIPARGQGRFQPLNPIGVTHKVQDEGTDIVSRTGNGLFGINFTGAGSTCVFNATTGLVDCTITSGGGGGLTHTVNGSALASATAIDFDDALPAAPASSVNINFQKDALDPTNVSANLLLTDVDGVGIGVSGSELILDNSELTANQTFWTGASASRTITYSLSGATDPVVTFADGVFNLTTGTFQQNGDDVIHKDTNTFLSTENLILDGSTNPRDITLGIIRILQTPNMDSTRGIAIITDAAGFGDTKALEVDWTATGVAAGDFEAVINLDIDTANSSGGNIIGLEITEVGTGSATTYGMLTGVGVNPILNEAGVFGNVETAFTFDSVFTDVTADFNSTGSDVQMFVSNGDLVYIGMAALFDEVEFILAVTASNAGIKPTFEYSDGATGWITFSPTDNTNGMRQNGDLVWIATSLAGWAQDTVNSISGKFWIRITRTAVTLTTPPTEDLVQVNNDLDFMWDSSGNLNIASLSSGFNQEIADDGFIRCANAEICMAWELATPGTDKTLIVDASDILQFNGTFNATAVTSGGNAVETTNNKDAANGYAGLDASSNLALSTIPDGTANQILGTDAAGTAAEHKSLATGTAGTDFAIVHTAGVVTFDLPAASGTNTGKLSNTDWTTFDGSVDSVTGGNGIASSGGETPAITFDPLIVQDGTGVAFSFSGLEFAGAGSDKVALLQGCADAEILKWDDESGGLGRWDCAADVSGGSPAWDSLTDPTGAVTMNSNANAELVSFLYTSALGATDVAFTIEQLTGNPLAGSILLEITAADTDILLLSAGAGANTIDITQAGAMTAEGTASITATAGATATGFFTTGEIEKLHLPDVEGLDTALTAARCVRINAGGTALEAAAADCNSGSGANTALSNLAAVAINLPLLPDAAAADDFGSATLPFKDLFLAGSSGTPGTNNFRITGASTSGTRVFTLADGASNSVIPDTGSANNFLTAIAGTGVISKAQPACADLSDASATCATAGATVALDNLAAVAINLPLLPDVAAADDFGSATLPFKDLFFAGSSGTPGTNNFRITGASTSGTRVFTVVDAASNSVVPNTGSANNFVTAIAATGVVSIAQPAFTDISGTATNAQGGTGIDTSSSTGVMRVDSGTTTVTELSGDVATSGSNATLIQAGVVASAELATANKTFNCNFVLFDSTGLSDTDDVPTVSQCSIPGRAITINEVRCEYTTGTAPVVQLQKDDGAVTNMLTSNLTCGTDVQGTCGTGCTTAFVSTENVMAANDNLDFVLVTANTSTRISMIVSVTVN